jgi:hypothetical protein
MRDKRQVSCVKPFQIIHTDPLPSKRCSKAPCSLKIRQHRTTYFQKDILKINGKKKSIFTGEKPDKPCFNQVIKSNITWDTSC